MNSAVHRVARRVRRRRARASPPARAGRSRRRTGSGFRYSQRAYLIQVFRREAGTFLFDPPLIADFTALDDRHPVDEEWVLHAASQDLACLREVGLDPERIFDTELGARLLGLPRVGLGAVVEELLGIHLAKEHSAADWSTRPLPQSWLGLRRARRRAAPRPARQDRANLDDNGKTEIARQEFAAVLASGEAARGRSRGVASPACTRCAAPARSRSRASCGSPATHSPARSTPLRAGWFRTASLVVAARALPATKTASPPSRSSPGGRAVGARSLVRRHRTRPDHRPSSRGAARPARDRLRLGPGRTAIPRPTHVSRPPARRRRRRSPIELDIPLENLLTPELLRRVAWSPPAEPTRGGRSATRSRRSVLARGRLRQPHRRSPMPLSRRTQSRSGCRAERFVGTVKRFAARQAVPRIGSS